MEQDTDRDGEKAGKLKTPKEWVLYFHPKAEVAKIGEFYEVWSLIPFEFDDTTHTIERFGIGNSKSPRAAWNRAWKKIQGQMIWKLSR